METAKELGMYKRNLLSVVAGDSIDLTEGRSLYLGFGASGGLGHGGKEHEFVPRLVEALAGKKMVGASAGNACKAAWTTAGEFFTLYEKKWEAGPRSIDLQNEPVLRLVEALAGKKVAGASAGSGYMAVWTDAGELFTFGNGEHWRLGHAKMEHAGAPYHTVIECPHA